MAQSGRDWRREDAPPEGPGEAPLAGGQLGTLRVAVKPRSPAGHPSGRVGHHLAVDHDVAQELVLRVRATASHTGTYWLIHRSILPFVPGSGGDGQGLRAGSQPLAHRSCRQFCGAASERMSMRQPVSRAARRAFCPSRPMARLSW